MPKQLEVYGYDQDPFYVIVGDTTVLIHRGFPPDGKPAQAPQPAPPADPKPVFTPPGHGPTWSALIADTGDGRVGEATDRWVAEFVEEHPDESLRLLLPEAHASSEAGVKSKRELLASMEGVASRYPSVTVTQLRRANG